MTIPTLSSHAKVLQGQAYQTIGNTISSNPSWETEGTKLVEEGKAELKATDVEGSVERIEGKVERLVLNLRHPVFFSAYGMLTNNQETLTEGNLKAEKGEFKTALAEGHLPHVSTERMKGKVESAAGIVTGDIDKQTSGNIRAEKAEWTQG